MTIAGIRAALATGLSSAGLGTTEGYYHEQLSFTGDVAGYPQLREWNPRIGGGTLGGGTNATQEWTLTTMHRFTGLNVADAVLDLEALLTDAALAAIEAANFSTHADGCVVTRVYDFGEYRVSDKRAIGCKIDVTVYGVSA